jgi:hypothetical protein
VILDGDGDGWGDSVGISEMGLPVGLMDGEVLGKGDSVGGKLDGDSMDGPGVGCLEMPLGFGDSGVPTISFVVGGLVTVMAGVKVGEVRVGFVVMSRGCSVCVDGDSLGVDAGKELGISIGDNV